MAQSRREFIAVTLAAAGAGLLPDRYSCADEFAFSDDPFKLGIASGYPDARGVVLWTRLAPEPLARGGGMPAEAVAVDWEVAEDERFRRVRQRGSTYATPDWGHSVHVEVAGLEPGRDYWYRFRSGGVVSPVGRTRTAPAEDGQTRELRVAVACCQRYETGFYGAYDAMAREDLDLVLHVGDYIYENRGIDAARSHNAPECYTLDDYRLRYAIYKSDPMLQAAHAGFPWMLTWDDHEVDNDYANGFSERDDPPELFLARRAAAYRAYYEHLPLPRRMAPVGAHLRLHTQRAFGDLVDVIMLDGRQYRSRPACGRGLVSPCRALYDQERTMLGKRQERWLEGVLLGSTARFKLLTQQTVFARMDQRPGPGVGYWNDGWSGYPAARQRLVDLVADHAIANPVILSGDIHAFLACDVHAEPGDADSRIVATELVTSSISSPGPSAHLVGRWLDENPNVHLARSDVRGFTRLAVSRDGLRADFIGLDDVRRADSPTYVLATYEIANGAPGISTG